MHIVDSISALKRPIQAWREAGNRIVFVPTMGNLHAGHLRLMEHARGLGDKVVAHIYVNPLQFGTGEDLAGYPRTVDEDRRKLEAVGVDLLFLPSDAVMYPRGLQAQTVVEVPGLSDILCGASRPGHFRGVATVVNRLFNLVQPHVAVFGKKDYQQLLIIRLMAEDLGMPVEIVGVDTVRDPDGLALSSRNGYLTPTEREAAPQLYAALGELRDRILGAGIIPPESMEATARQLEKAGFRPDYITVRRRQDLGEPAPDDRALVILAAAWLGQARLIDNLELDLNPPS